MITNLKITNCYAFNKTVEFSMKADMRAKKFNTNIYQTDNDINILKSAIIYGPNNTGKTTFINCIKIIKDILSNKKVGISSNLFEKDNICQMQISFLQNENEYQFEYKYDSKSEEYIYEKFSKIEKTKEDIYYIKDTEQGNYKCSKDKKLEKILSIASKNNILIYTIETKEFSILEDIKRILTNFADSIDIIYMNDFQSDKKTIQLLKNKDNITKKVVDFITSADLYLENYEYNDDVKFDIKTDDNKLMEMFREKLMKNQNFMEHMKLVSYYKGIPVPSHIFDSVGTRKIATLAGYIIEALEQGKILVVDEIDSSLHFKLTRAILGLFNNEKNKNSQLICTLHDISLLDCKKMFRKDQIYFTAKDSEQTYLYSLKEFNSHEDGVRSDSSDILDKYEKGVFGAIPEPDLISVLLEEEV